MSKKHDPDEAAIRALDAEWSKAARARDVDRVMTFYAKDGSVVWPEQPVAKGHPAIRASWKKAYKTSPKLYLEFKPTHIEIAGGRDMASDFGAVYFAPHVKSNDTRNVGKYLVVWKREKGTWKVLYDCYNMNGTNNPVNTAVKKPGAIKKRKR
jgi:uncharacterized protein (TIGR02246 family)